MIPNTNLEITQKAMDDFVKIQRHMLIAKKENAVETYAIPISAADHRGM